jgi:predicted Zn-dependent protease
MAYSPFKMKGSPMQRNFGIGASPAKAIGKGKEEKGEFTYVPDPKRERTDKQGRTQKEVMEMRYKKENDYTGKVNKYSKKHGGLTDEQMKKAKGKLNKLKGETKYSQDSITGVNKQLAAKASAELNAKKKKKKEADDEFDAL